MYDVIIVGGGIAGSHLASRLDGLNVLLIEKNKKVISKDSGIVSGDFLNFFDSTLIKCGITKIEAFSPAGHTFTLNGDEPFAYIIKRLLLSKYLLAKARANASVIYENVLNVVYEKDFVTVNTTGGSYQGRIVVGADGANSVVRRCAGIQSPMLSLGIMVKTKNKLDGGINVFFNKHYSPDFFSWIIPQNDEYGIISSIRPREHLLHFEGDQYLPGGDISAHLIPVGYARSYANRMLLAGDACGHNKPLTGGGIIFSLKAASYAAVTIKDAFERKRFDKKFLKQYETMWKKDFAWEIDRQFLVRMLYRRLSNRNIDNLFLQFGPSIEKLRNFDYDNFSRAWIKLPKIKLMKFMIAATFNML